MLERTFLDTSNAESFPWFYRCHFLFSNICQVLQALGKLCLVETLHKNYLERHHVSKCNLITSSTIEYFSTREGSILNLFLFFQGKKKFKYRYNLSSVFWNLIYITFKSISRRIKIKYEFLQMSRRISMKHLTGAEEEMALIWHVF